MKLILKILLVLFFASISPGEVIDGDTEIIGTLGVTSAFDGSITLLTLANDFTDPCSTALFILNDDTGNFGLSAPHGNIYLVPKTGGDIFIQTTGILGSQTDGAVDLGAVSANRFGSAWLTGSIGVVGDMTLGGQLIVEDGTAADPTIYFDTLDAGIYAGTGITFVLSEAELVEIAGTAVTLADNINLTLGGTSTVTTGTGGLNATSGNIRTTGDLNIGTDGIVLDVDSALGTVGIGTAATAVALLNVTPNATRTISDDFSFIFGSGAVEIDTADKDLALLNYQGTFLNDAGVNVASMGSVNVKSTFGALDVGDDYTTTSGYGIRTQAVDLGGGAKTGVFTLTSYDHLTVLAPTWGAGTVIGTETGLRLPDISKGSTNWAMHTGTGPNRFGDAIYFTQTDGAEKIDSDADGTLDLYAGTSIDFHQNQILLNGAETRWNDAGNSNYVGFKAPALTGNQIWVLPDADGGADEVLVTDGAGNLGWGDVIANGYPQRATMWHDEATVTNGNALLQLLDVGQRYASRSYQNAPADNDAFSNSFFLKAGTYEFSVLGTTSSGSGQVDWAIDGDSIVVNQEWYSAGTVRNVIKIVSSVNITTDGYHKLTGLVDSKHASSSGYGLALTKYWFWVASDDPART